jgi:hypothetical protein
MSKNLIKVAILIVVVVLVYSIFWFFKVGQVEKKINNFISENNANISAGEVVVSGFPLSQKVSIKDLKFSIPNPVFGNRQILVKSLEANTGIFSNDFSLTIPMDAVSTIDTAGVSSNVTFNQAPEVSFSFNPDGFAKFSYQDGGYKILDQEQKTIYAATSSKFHFESTTEGDKITHKIKADVKEIEGFDVIDMYKNSFEKKIIEGIKTGEITLGSNSSNPVSIDVSTLAPTPTPAAVVQTDSVATSSAMPIADKAIDPATMPTQNDLVATDITPAAPALALEAPIETPKEAIKSNFTMDIEYYLMPVTKSATEEMPTDPTQIQESPTQYSKLIKITNLEFSNSDYKIFVNGELNSFQDDTSLSGSIGIKVEKIDNLVGYLSKALATIAKSDMPSDLAAKAQDLAAIDSSLAVPTSEDPYKVFLVKITQNLGSVTKEVAAKNSVTLSDTAAFDIRREKNLEFLVNETSIREILGKF